MKRGDPVPSREELEEKARKERYARVFEQVQREHHHTEITHEKIKEIVAKRFDGEVPR